MPQMLYQMLPLFHQSNHVKYVWYSYFIGKEISVIVVTSQGMEITWTGGCLEHKCAQSWNIAVLKVSGTDEIVQNTAPQGVSTCDSIHCDKHT